MIKTEVQTVERGSFEPPAPTLKKHKQKWKRREELCATLMASLPFIGFLLFTMFPMGLSLVVSFTDLRSYDLSRMEWVGFDNYVAVFKYDLFFTAIENTAYFSLSVPINMAASLFIANLMTKPLIGRKPARIILFLPTICSGVAVTVMWTWIYEANYGAINTLLASIGLPKIPFMQNADWFMPAILFMCLWQSGTNIITMQTALTNVNENLIEAARLDGANEMQVFWKIIFPSITPTLFYILTMNLITAMQEMAIFQVITTNGVGPGYKAVTLTYLLYRMAFTYTATEGLGMGSALAWIIAIMIILVNRLNFWLSKKWVHYD
jgi:multiple sugar transport system permease protein